MLPNRYHLVPFTSMTKLALFLYELLPLRPSTEIIFSFQAHQTPLLQIHACVYRNAGRRHFQSTQHSFLKASLSIFALKKAILWPEQGLPSSRASLVQSYHTSLSSCSILRAGSEALTSAPWLNLRRPNHVSWRRHPSLPKMAQSSWPHNTSISQ